MIEGGSSLSPAEHLKYINEAMVGKATTVADLIATNMYGLPSDGLPSIASVLYLGSDDEYLREFNESIRPHVSVKTIGEGQLDVKIYLPEDVRESLAGQNQFSQEYGIAGRGHTLAEEIDHWIYIQSHFNLHGRTPAQAAAELVAAVNKVNLLHLLNPEAHYPSHLLNQIITDMNSATTQSPIAGRVPPPDYILGHRLAHNFIAALNETTKTQGESAASELYAAFLQLPDVDQIRVVVSARPIPIYPGEAEPVLACLRDMGIPEVVVESGYLKYTGELA